MTQPLLPVVILMGGFATRLYPLTEKTPKALIEINGEPFISHQLKLLRKKNITDVLLCVGNLSDQIKNFVGNGKDFGLNITYSCDYPNLLGTAGAIKKALPDIPNDNFFVLYGDSYLDCDYFNIQSFFQKSDKHALMTVYRNNDAWDTSNVEYVSPHIIAYDKQNKTPRMQYIDYGLGIFNKMAFAEIAQNMVCDLASVYQNLLKKNQLAAYEVSKRFFEIGSLQGIAQLCDHLKSVLDSELAAG